MNKDKIKHLFYKYFNDLTTDEENRELARLLQQPNLEDDVKQLMEEAWDTFYPHHKIFPGEISEEMLSRILGGEEKAGQHFFPRMLSFFRRSAAAAIIMVAATGGLLFYYFRSDNRFASDSSEVAAPAVSPDILPGSNKAFLTLSDGRNIILDNASPGLLTTQGGTRIIKEEGDRLAYQATAHEDETVSGSNTLRTPRGGQYHLVLPDGTKAWLNAASSIVYPVRFTGSRRQVRIEGEVYFEVAKQLKDNSKVPFIVTAGDVSIEVLGTQFNVNAYSDEVAIKTTLLEGAVKVTTSKSSTLLNPGHEARVAAKSDEILISKANTDQAVAWKNGYFQFQQAGLQEIMRQLSKWYDVDVVYEGKPLEKKFTGEIPRSATLLQVLEILELNQIQLRIVDKQVIIRT
ncbi:MAG: hypothetical protein ABS46_08370 [Cytophagaceae bacterium SCN 52-12]|nr:MAG: hypothetical protein ABS46_08370 [Cytophagaceae bacterium SCN 52-12]